ncbi:MAG: hypothetical protein KKA07_01855 [Bacteroidetes bacterium]|nr:hypothetical protein [Bacteroidota bacterium]
MNTNTKSIIGYLSVILAFCSLYFVLILMLVPTSKAKSQNTEQPAGQLVRLASKINGGGINLYLIKFQTENGKIDRASL